MIRRGRADRRTATPAGKLQGLFPGEGGAAAAATEDEGFFRYLVDYRAMTHGAGDRLLGLVFGGIAAVVLSFLKPAIEYRGIAIAAAGLAGLAIVAGLWFLTRRTLAYFLVGERVAPDSASSLSSAMFSGGKTAMLPLCLLVAVEYFNPQAGVLANLVPRLQEEQRQWLASVEEAPEGDHLDVAVARGDGEEDGESPGAELVSFSTEDVERPAREASESSASVAVATHAEAPTALAEPPESARSATTERTTQSAGAAGSTETVMAEGAGTSADEALKGAFRNAVRQVVGAVVDAETLIENDEIISDNVLTYSDGFIKSFDRVAGSEKVDNGLRRVKIKAIVERRSVIAKLKAANVTTKGIDGESMFAEVVTQLDAESNIQAMLKKALEGFPQSLISAKVVDAPELLGKTNDRAAIRVIVRVEPDLEAYKTFVARLQPVLEKIAKDKGEFTVTSKPEVRQSQYKSINYFTPTGFLRESMVSWMPKSFPGVTHNLRLNMDAVTVALSTQRSQAADRLESRYYLMDKAVQPLLMKLGGARGNGKLSLLDADGNNIATDRFTLLEQGPYSGDEYEASPIVPGGNHFNNEFIFFDRAYDYSYSKPERAMTGPSAPSTHPKAAIC